MKKLVCFKRRGIRGSAGSRGKVFRRKMTWQRNRRIVRYADWRVQRGRDLLGPSAAVEYRCSLSFESQIRRGWFDFPRSSVPPPFLANQGEKCKVLWHRLLFESDRATAGAIRLPS